MKIEARAQGKGWIQIDECQLARFCVHLAGGGYTPSQTAKAMEIQRKILDGTPYRSASGLEIRALEE